MKNDVELAWWIEKCAAILESVVNNNYFQIKVDFSFNIWNCFERMLKEFFSIKYEALSVLCKV